MKKDNKKRTAKKQTKVNRGININSNSQKCKNAKPNDFLSNFFEI